MKLTVNNIIEYQHNGAIKVGIFKWMNEHHIGLISLDGRMVEYDISDIIITNIRDRDFRWPDLSVA
jgi:hypothetical protein